MIDPTAATPTGRPEPTWCWVCEQHRPIPMQCGADCMRQDFPREDTPE